MELIDNINTLLGKNLKGTYAQARLEVEDCRFVLFDLRLRCFEEGAGEH